MGRKYRSVKSGYSSDGEAMIICDECLKPDKWAKKVNNRGYLCLKCRRSNEFILKN